MTKTKKKPKAKTVLIRNLVWTRTCQFCGGTGKQSIRFSCPDVIPVAKKRRAKR